MPLTSSRAMGNIMREKRRALDDYMYEPPKAAVAVTATPDEEMGEMPMTDTPEEEAAEGPEATMISVLGPDDEVDPDLYTYERMDSGAWMVYPPGVPCEGMGSKVQLDHVASETEFADMEAALGESGVPAPGGTAELGEEY